MIAVFTSLQIICMTLSIIIGGTLGLSLGTHEESWLYLPLGALFGALFGGLLLFSEMILKNQMTLRTLNTLVLGLFVGSLTGYALQTVIRGALMGVNTELSAPLQAFIYLAGLFFALNLTVRAADELHLVIPFIHLKPTAPKKRDLLLDASVLQDPRLIDLAASGLIDEQALLPRFVITELHEQSSGDDEQMRTKARCSLEVISKLETLPFLELRYTDIDFPDVKDPVIRLTRIARHIDANVLTADINRVQQASIEGIRIVNIHSLSNALKPMMQKGEVMTIKVQRQGKDPQQGIGYLDDGTMVVINGGANYMLKTIQVQVLGVKHTASGRMIFCNAAESEDDEGFRREGGFGLDQNKRYLMS